MSLHLKELLTLVGRLDDGEGTDTPRERFRRFLTERIDTVDAVRQLLDQSHLSLGDQHTRARQDLVLLLGRFLGFDITFGRYEAPAGAVRLEGHWRARRHARIAIEVRGEQTVDADVESLARTVAALSASLPADLGERWVGLCVTTPFYTAAARLERQLAQRPARDIRCISLDSLLWLAGMAAATRVERMDVIRLLTSGPDSDFMVNLMRRLTESSGRPPAVPGRRADDLPADGGHRLSIVARPERDRAPEAEPGYWLVVLASDESASPEQLVDAVIGRRQVIGLCDAPAFEARAREGDWVCFLIPGTGIVGHGQLDAAIPDAASVIRGADRFTAVFRLRNVMLYEVPKPIVDDTLTVQLESRIPKHVISPVLCALTAQEYEQLTAGSEPGAVAAGS
ncbi:MAG TPA: hypothetical protein VM032_05305 [Vicinamibacterales bacterium]|nr:hypothetical protein [Vicinamibacterales bacterium]